MDTRSKILTLDEAARISDRRRVVLVTGYFDVLLASHVRRLEEIAASHLRHDMMVAVLDPPRPLLPAVARAELVAALRVVDYVVSAGSMQPEQILARIQADRVIGEEAAHIERSSALIEHVRRRQSA
ncbi:MAG: hypothetical protein ACRD8O_01470 [Bryobacteraceae bacterium]